MIISLLLVEQINVHKCNHDLEMGNITRTLQGPKLSRNLKNVEWKNIRIKLDYNYIDKSKDDQRTCQTVRQQVRFQGKTYFCEQRHILTSTKISAIKGTLDNVKTYLERLLSVIPYNSDIRYKEFNGNYGYETNFGSQTASGVDIVLAILSRPRDDDDSTLASAAGLSEERTYHRPIFGVVFLNPMAVPEQVQNENSKDSRFFYTCVHEIFHALGISSSYFDSYHPHESTSPHSRITCSFTKYGRSFTFLVTPYAHKFAMKRFGVQEFQGTYGKCPSGIEIENDGGQGTAGSHLEARSYMTDLMVGMTIQTEAGPYSRLTDAVLAVLMDTGNYKVNWQMGQPLVWGNPESIDGNTITNFAIGPPQNVFPKYYMRDFSVQEIWYASFDFKFSGPFSGPVTINGLSNEQKQFYDPKGIGVGTTQVYDFIPFYFPNYVCPNGQAILPSTMSYSYHKCGTYTCDGYKSFTIQVNKDNIGRQWESVTCTKENATKEFSLPLGYDSRKVSCVDPERFCRSVKLNEMKFVVDPFNPDTRQLNSDSPTPTQPEPDNNPSAPEPGNNPSGPEPGNNPSGPGVENPSGTGGNETTTTGSGGSDENSKAAEEKAKKKKLIIIAACAGVAALIVITFIAVLVIFAIRNAKENAYLEDSDANYIV
ncbi:Clan MA, family M8, leishmanolysin-like metallopeptidase [Trichomonas vaginalis G3]|uniref:Clan MA, family M8, leishmanolysin-like metallopeptidase n=1 Tax=Trichomonas vaginalis (strain ATCC PRA-98 / G3) TaxID=412133 RepID=A2FTN8_TRIV3|nr:regulation of choline O-acetyltransferase protein [Trichomonas vaginalis G3]EAX91743.1 Clan MA, family M8, leishmanolysin-like metallopeptidase [Trichomonas vaginalis G3]KAI5537197.1 regulation of choline O-acetyltransferase protein [Trichomonas vaginalis G3]|eukprot:XP_001304673.1 Clan MA, family M8, leishmanolysin-like metallopeptidase [Trichomonas vaginalis G3]